MELLVQYLIKIDLCIYIMSLVSSIPAKNKDSVTEDCYAFTFTLSGVFSKTIYPILTTLYQLMYYVLMDNILKEKSL